MHGNRVWHASIATCMYLKHYYENSPGSSSWQSLELGAGTALPSLFLGCLVVSSNEKNGDSSQAKPFLHVTDGKQYRNIRQILFSLSKQPASVLDSASFRISPHNWGQEIDVFLTQECQDSAPRCYDLVIVSDCIYNPTYHKDLLKTLATTLRLPEHDEDLGGRAILSFSLHGNTPDKDIWNFIDQVIPETRHEEWRLQAMPVPVDGIASTTLISNKGKEQPIQGRHGWDMEQTMKDLELWTANIEPKRWFSFLYEIKWTRDENT